MIPKIPSPILPGSTLGVLGSGQLGRMFAIAARQMGYRVHTFSPDSDTPTGQVADVEITASYDDLDAVRDFARNVGVVTFEFENVPGPTAAAAAEFAPVRPGGDVLHTTQHRLREKTFLARHGFPVTPFREIRTVEDVRAAVRDLGPAAVLKTASFGYDGKGQSKVRTLAEAEAAIGAGDVQRIYEAFVDFDREVSVVAARGVDGSFAHWGVIENTPRQPHPRPLRLPRRRPPTVAKEAERDHPRHPRTARRRRRPLRRVLPDEIRQAPGQRARPPPPQLRPPYLRRQHHQPVRAAAPRRLRPAAGLHAHAPPRRGMAKLLGDLWEDGEPDWAAACGVPDVKLHLYGKAEPRPGRKMGHLTALADTAQDAAQRVELARQRLRRLRQVAYLRIRSRFQRDLDAVAVGAALGVVEVNLEAVLRDFHRDRAAAALFGCAGCGEVDRI